MKTIKFLSMFMAAVTLSFQGCKTVKDIPVVQLSGKWTLQTFDGAPAAERFTEKIPTIEFDIMTKHISGTGGCNSYNGAFDLNRNEFSAPNLASTQMMCLSANKEAAFFRLLGNVSVLSLDNGKLLFTQGGRQVLIFTKVKPLNAADLTGTWRLKAIQGASANARFTGKIPTLSFNADESRVSGNAGCNSYNGAFTLDGNSLSITKLRTTRMACADMESEKTFTGLLSGTSTVELDGNTLTLKDGNLVQLSFEKEE
jgi:heat shock protein HslJ